MSTPPIIPPITAAGAIQAATTGVTNRDEQAQPNGIPPGVSVTGFVINRDPSNNPIVRTQFGDVTIPTSQFIKAGSQVTFQSVIGQNAGLQIVSINNLSLGDYATQTTRAVQTDSITPPELEPQIPLPAAQLSSDAAAKAITYPILQSVVLQANPTTPPNVPAVLTQLQAGTPITLTVNDVELPPIPVAVNTLAQQPSAIANLLPAAQAQTGAAVPLLATTVNAAITAGNAAYQQSAFATGIAPMLIGAVTQKANTNSTGTATNPNLPVAEGEETPPQNPAPASPQQTPAQNTPQTPLAQTGAAQPKSTGNGQLFSATVIGHGEDGLNIVQTNFATLKIYTAQPLPTGTTLQVQAEVAEHVTPAIISAFTDLASKLPSSSRDFSYLTQAFAQLQSDPGALRDVIQQLPVLGPRFTSGLLFFLSAVKSGGVADVLSPRARTALDALSPTTLAHFSKDIADANETFIRSPLNDWKTIPLPLIFQNEAHTARLYIRDEPQNAGGVEGTAGGQRFLLDVQLSELGPMQLDGFIRQGTGAKSFELYLRSDLPLDSNVSQDILQIFTDATGAVGLASNIVFQHGPEHFVRPQMKPLGPETGPDARTILA